MGLKSDYSFEVVHPVYGTVIVSAADKAQALVLAAGRWGVRWTELAADAAVNKRGKAVAYHCRRCNGPTAKEGVCPECEKKMRILRREMAGIRTPDRRAGMSKR